MADQLPNNDQLMPEGLGDMATLVTGGSGYIGRQLVKGLSQLGQTVVCMYHHRLPEPMSHVYPVCSDMSSAELLAAPLRGVKTVVHLAWEGGLVGPSAPLNHRAPGQWGQTKNLKSVANLIEAMEKAGTRRIVFLSALGATRKAQTPYLQEKYLAELAILNSKIPEKIILRSGICCAGLGVHDRFVRSIVNVMKLPMVYPVPSANQDIAPVVLRDLVQTTINVCKQDNHVGSGILELSGSEHFKVEELFKVVKDKHARGAKMPLRGLLGRALLPLLERDGNKARSEQQRLHHYLELDSTRSETIATENKLAEAIPNDRLSLRDSH